MPKKLRAVSTCRSMAKDRAEMALLEHPLHRVERDSSVPSRNGLVLCCPKVVIYLTMIYRFS